MRVAPGDLIFPERTVLLASASLEQMQHSMLTLNSIAELRRAKETAEFFDSLRQDEQQEWLEELLERTEFPADADEVPRVCLLDTGVNRGHPLLGPALAAGDVHTVEPGWGTDDAHGHGTQMAGVALAGDLTPRRRLTRGRCGSGGRASAFADPVGREHPGFQCMVQLPAFQ